MNEKIASSIMNKITTAARIRRRSSQRPIVLGSSHAGIAAVQRYRLNAGALRTAEEKRTRQRLRTALLSPCAAARSRATPEHIQSRTARARRVGKSENAG